MESEAVPTSSALFGADGTQLPDPLPVLPDPLTGPERSPWPDTAPTSPVPLPRMPDGRAMRAAIAAVLADEPAAQPGGTAPNRSAPPVAIPPASAPQVSAPRVSAPQRAPVPAGQPRPFTPFPLPADLRRRIRQDSARQLQSRSSGGVRTGCIIALIIIGVVAFNIIAAIVQSVSALFS